MATVFQFQRGRFASATLANLFSELRHAHTAVQSAALELAKSCAEPSPDKTLRSNGWFKLSGAKKHLQLVFQFVCERINPFASDAERRTIATLVNDAESLNSFSCEHASVWTSDALTKNWANYCAASKQMRARILELVAREKALLYPILERLTLRGSK